MRRECVVAVRADGWGPGSGYVIAPRLVLTSGHVVGPVGSGVRLFRPGSAPVHDGCVVWRGGLPGARDDAAVVLVEDEGWAGPGAVVRWGRTVTFQPGRRCQTWGVPDAAQVGAVVELAQVQCTLNPGSGFAGDRYLLDVQGAVPETEPDGGSGWGGLSGAAVFSGDLLAGVVVSAPRGWHRGQLAAVPAYVLLHDAALRAVLAEHGALSELEALEFQHLAVGPGGGGGPVRSPAALLDARRSVVPFHGRESVLAELVSWSEGEGFSACLVHGPGGQGKTRLADELGVRLAEQRWAVLWLRAGASDEELGVLADAVVPLLVTVDYAESRSGQLAALWEACIRHQSGSPLRVLLLARTAGAWWRRAQTASASATDLLDGAAELLLPVLDTDAAGRAQAYQAALDAFAHALVSMPGWSDRGVLELAEGPREQQFGKAPLSALGVHMTALADLLDAARPVATDPASHAARGASGVEDRLLAHEKRYWTESATAYLRACVSEESLREAMAAAHLLGADTLEQADALLARVPGVADQTYDVRRVVRTWISTLYPPAAANQPWSGLQPDRLAERFIGRYLTDAPEHLRLPGALVTEAEAAQVEHLVTVYARAAAHWVFEHALDLPLTTLIAQYSADLAPAAIEVATRVEHPAPLLSALQQIGEDPATGLSELTRLADLLPNTSYALADWAAQLTTRLVSDYRDLASNRPGQFLPLLAGSLNNLSTRLGELGRREEALAAITEAVDIRRRLAEARPDAFQPDLASSLNNLSNRLSELGRSEEALAAITEAVDIRRRLAEARPDAFQPNLASSLNNLSNSLSELGRSEEALAAITEAVDIRRRLAEARPDAFQPNLASSLNNLSNSLSELGRSEEALAAITEAVDIRRRLAEARPDAFQPDLAMSLNNLSNRLSELGRREEALAAITEAVEIYRHLAEARPDAFQPDLAMSLNNLSNRLSELGRREEALAAITEAVDIRRRLAEARPDAFQPNLASSLNNLSNSLSELGRSEEALAAITEAVDIRRRLAEARPDAFQPDLAMSLNNLSNRLSELGRREEALAAITEAVEIYRHLAEARPDAFQPDLAMSLNNLSNRLSELGRREEALAAITEAVDIRRRLAEARPDAFQPNLASSLNNLSNSLSELGRSEEALAAITEAVDIRRRLAEARPDAFQPNLASSLNNLSNRLSELGRREEALAAITEAVEIYRHLAEARPSVYQAALERSLQVFNQRASQKAVQQP